MQAVVLAGGLGTRLRGVIGDALPKPMAPFGERPFLELLLDQLVDGGADDVVLLVGHRSEVIVDHVGSSFRGVPVRYSVETEPLGTGGAITLAAPLLDERFLLVNGDTYLDIDLTALAAAVGVGSLALGLVRVPDVARYGAVEVDDTRVVALREKGGGGPGLINGGVHALHRSLLERMPAASRFSFETDVLAAQLADLRPAYVVSEGPFFDIGVPDDYAAAVASLAPHLVD